MPDIEKWVREADVTPTCACAERKCGPHRCWPSRIYLLTIIGLLGFVAYLLSELFYRQDQKLGEYLAKDREASQVELHGMMAQGQLEWQQQVETQRIASDRQLSEIDSLLARVHHLNWALATPEIERDLQLKQEFEALHQERRRP